MLRQCVNKNSLFLTLIFGFLSISSLMLSTTKVDLSQIMTPPSFEHLLGTDNVGRDLFTRLLEAFWSVVVPIWTWITIGSLVATVVASFLLTLPKSRILQICSPLLKFPISTFMSVPIGIVIFAVAVAFELSGVGVVAGCLTLITGLRTCLYVMEKYAVSHRLAYWQVHEALGGTPLSRVWRYGILNGWSIDLISLWVFHLQVGIVIEASISYLGFGIQEPDASLGNMVASHLDAYLNGHWFSLVGILIFLMICTALPILLKSSIVQLILQNEVKHDSYR